MPKAARIVLVVFVVLLFYGLEPPFADNTAFLDLVAKGTSADVQSAINAGTNVNAKDKIGSTALPRRSSQKNRFVLI